jgi:hypothetical protein
VDAKPSFVLKLSRADMLIVAGLSSRSATCRRSSIRAAATGSTRTAALDASIGCEILQRPTAQVTRAMGDVPLRQPALLDRPQ